MDGLDAASDWLTAGLVSGGNSTAVTRWDDRGLALDHLLPNGAPVFRTAVTPTGLAAVEFRGGAFNDALADTVAAGKFGLNGATSFTAAIPPGPVSGAANKGNSGVRYNVGLHAGVLHVRKFQSIFRSRALLTKWP